MVPSSHAMSGEEWARVRVHGLAVAAVLAAAAARAVLAGSSASFLFSSVVIAFAAAAGGFSVGGVAVLTAVLAARMVDAVPLSTAVWFGVEGGLVAALASTLSLALDADGRLFEEKDARSRELQAEIRRLRAIDLAGARLERAATEYTVVLLDCDGRINGWREGAVRLFGYQASIEGEPALRLVAAASADALNAALTTARGGAPGRLDAIAVRADGTTFDSDIEIRPLTGNRFDGFVMLVRDRTQEQTWNAFAASAAEAQVALREEVDVAQRQLATLQYVTDPTVNALPPSEAAATLLERLRVAVDADGAALIRVGAFRRRLLSLSDTLAAQGAADRRQNDARTPQDDRILLIQNDPARVAAMSLVNWPETVSSMIAVPVLSGGTIEGTIEVVGLRSRRSTEWEIALVQVVAARIAGRMQDESYVDAGAVA